jgi:hypothetical protein
MKNTSTGNEESCSLLPIKEGMFIFNFKNNIEEIESSFLGITNAVFSRLSSICLTATLILEVYYAKYK